MTDVLAAGIIAGSDFKDSSPRIMSWEIEHATQAQGRSSDSMTKMLLGTVKPLFLPSLCTSLGLVAVLLIYKWQSGQELTSAPVARDGPWTVGLGVMGSKCGGNGGIPLRKSIAQILQENVERVVWSQETEIEELAGLDLSTRALVVELVRSLRSRSAVAEPGQQPDWEVLKFDYGVKRVVKRLVVCSAYRTAREKFTVITLSPDFTVWSANPDFKSWPPKEPALKRTCSWLEDGNAGAPFFGSEREMNETGRKVVSNGEAEFQWIGESQGTSYDVLLVHCTFPEPVGTDSSGGFLYLTVVHGDGSGELTSAPTELAPVYHERPETLSASMYESSSPRQFKYEFAYCSSPAFTKLTPNHVKQFLMYHYALLDGAVHFFIYYTRGVDPEILAVLQPLVDAGTMTLVNFQKEAEYDTWYHSQDLAINDCLYKVKNIARWVLSWDMDEYLHPRPPLTLPVLLEKYKDAPWISFGKIDFSLSYCAAPDNSTVEEWAVERILYRAENPMCGDLCDGDGGGRKWMANPRLVKAGRIHRIVDYLDGGVVLSTNIARMNHYRGLVAPRGRFICEEIRDPLLSNSTLGSDGETLLWSDLELASLVKSKLKNSVESLPMFGGLERP